LSSSSGVCVAKDLVTKEQLAEIASGASVIRSFATRTPDEDDKKIVRVEEEL